MSSAQWITGEESASFISGCSQAQFVFLSKPYTLTVLWKTPFLLYGLSNVAKKFDRC